MIKLFYNSGLLIKSFDYNVIFKYIIDNPDISFDILLDYTKISRKDFCKLFLAETKNYQEYLKLESILNYSKNIYQYGTV